jgi:hypothetical protein
MKTFVLSLFLFLSLVSVSQTPKEIEEYFNEVAYGSDAMIGSQTQIITKWEKNINLFVEGHYTTQDLIEIKNIVSELNTLLSDIKITIIKNKLESNSIVYFGDFNTFNKRYLSGTAGNINCNGYCGIFGLYASPIIESVKIFISSNINSIDRKHVVIEEITQSLGLANDSWKYPDSIFYEGYSTTDRLSKIDKEVIKMLYK